MSELILNARGSQFTRNQSRAAEFIKEFAQKEGVSVTIGEDCYVAPTLIQTDILERLCQKVQAPELSVDKVDNFILFEDNVSDQELRRFQKFSTMLSVATERIDSTHTQKPNFADYEAYIIWLVKTLELVQQVEGIPQVDFNSDRFLVDYAPSSNEIKVAINLFGTDIIAVQDINKRFDKDVSIFANGLWGIYLINFINGFGLQVSTQNVNYYAQFIGATALQTTNLTTFFNLVQMFFSVFWLWLSDIVGRKPIYMIITAVYAAATGLLIVAPTFEGNYPKQISYLQGIRALMGSCALIAPLGFVMVSDVSPPKNRSLASVMINCSSAVGGIFASILIICLGTAKKYNTKNEVIGTETYNYKNEISYIDAHYWSMAAFIVGFLLCTFVLRESQPRIVAARHLKKLGITAPKTKEIKAQPMYKVLFEMCRNPNIVMLFFAYWINLIGTTNTRTGQQVFVMKMFGFSDGNTAKSYVNTIMIVTLILAVLVSTFGSKWFVKRYGEIRMIIFSQVTTVIESIISFAVNMPIPKETIFVTQILASLTMLVCDAIFLQLVSMYTTPQNRGQVLGLFQIGNSLGRTLSGVVTGVMYDYNIREAQFFNTLFASVCLILLSILKPPIQRTEMDAAAMQMKEQQKHDNIV